MSGPHLHAKLDGVPRDILLQILKKDDCVYDFGLVTPRGAHFEAPEPVRTVLTVLDGVVAGEGNGPLAPDDRPLGVILAGLDPVAVDLAALRLMGFDERCIPKVREAMAGGPLPISAVRSAADVAVFESAPPGAAPARRGLDALTTEESFVAHPGWLGHVENRPCAA